MKRLNWILLGVFLVMLMLYGFKSCINHESRPCGFCGVRYFKHKYVHTLDARVCPQSWGCFSGYENPPCTIHFFIEPK